MNTRKTIATIAMIASLFLVTGMAAAQATPGAADVQSNDDGQFTAPTTAESVATDPGNVYSANVSTNQSTQNWAGLYGNATGTLVLGANSERLYEWTAQGKNVYATEAGTVDFTSLATTTTSAVDGAYTWDGPSSNASNTLTDGSVTVNALGTDYSTTGTSSLNGADSSVWETGVLEDTNNGNFLYTGVVQNTGETAYNGEEADYQLMAPSTTNAGTTTYNMYLELE